ncbi:MAG: Calx-beta domain-containing protein [Ilumatobacteraceae bacterium]
MKMNLKFPKVGRPQAAALGVVVIALGAVLVTRGGGESNGETALLITPRAVERRTLSDVLTVSGEVRREEVQSVRSSLTGQVNRIDVEDGATIEIGTDLFAIDGRTAVAVPGDFPFFRSLQVGSEGADVRQLEQILADEGFEVGEVDALLSEATRSGLAAWQVAHGYGSNGAEGDETVTLNLVANSAGYTIGKANSAAFVIGPSVNVSPGSSRRPSAASAPEIEISASKYEVAEGSTVTFSLRSSARLDDDLTIDISVGGTAVEGIDYSVAPRTVTMRDGSAFASFDLTIESDDILETAEDIVVSVVGGTSGDYVLGPRYRARVVISDEAADVEQQLTISTANESVREGSSAVFIVQGAVSVDRDLVFDVSYSGTSTVGDDFLVATPDQLTLPAGRFSVRFEVQTRQDGTSEADESLTISLIPKTTSDARSTYSVGLPASATVRIQSSDLPELTVSGGGRIAEGSTGSFRIVADTPVAESTSVNYQLGGTATPGQDYTVVSGTVLMRAGSSSVSVPIDALADDVMFQPSDMIVAEWPAKVGKVAVDSGDYVAPGQEILNLTEPQLTVTLKVGAAERAELEVGQKAAVDLTVGDQILEGVISSLDDSATVGPNGEQIYEGVVTVDSTFEAVDGAAVTVDVTLDEVADALAVPVAAILRSADGDVVRVVNDEGTITRVPVTIGLIDREWAQILTGQKGDELVVVDVESEGVAAGA